MEIYTPQEVAEISKAYSDIEYHLQILTYRGLPCHMMIEAERDRIASQLERIPLSIQKILKIEDLVSRVDMGIEEWREKQRIKYGGLKRA